MPLHTDYRPERLSEVYGNKALKATLQGILENPDKGHAFLITGPSGCGKTTIANVIKNELHVGIDGCVIYNASNTRGIDTVRDVIDLCSYVPLISEKRMLFFDECHQLTTQAQEALLKEIEEVKKHVYWVFATTEPHKLKETFKRRCYQLQVLPLIDSDMKQLIQDVLLSELDNAVEKGDRSRSQTIRNLNYDKIIEYSNGSPGHALKYLDMAISQGSSDIPFDEIFLEDKIVLQICRAIVSTTMSKLEKWKTIIGALKVLTVEPEEARWAILNYISKIIINPFPNSMSTNDLMQIVMLFTESFMYSGMAGLELSCYLACEQKGS